MLSASTLPRVGIGLDYKYRDDYAKTLPELCRDLSSRLSHLSVVSLMNLEQARAFRQLAGQLPVLHHLSNIAPGNPEGPNLDLLRKQDAMSRVLSARWCGEDIGIWALGPYQIPYFVPPLLERAVLEFVASGVRRVQELSSVPFLAEIPSFSCVVGAMSLGQFFTELVERTGCAVVLDLSHVYSYSLVTNADPMGVLQSLPLEAVREVHIAGGKISPVHAFRYIDNHSDAVMPEVMRLLREAVRRCPRLGCVTYEIGVAITEETMQGELTRIQGLLEEERFEPSWQ
jgi:uncharacterized protein